MKKINELMFTLCFAISLSAISISAYAVEVGATIPATPHWGWQPSFGMPWGNCPNYTFDTTDEFGCAPIAEACHPNRGQAGYSPFSGRASCVIFTADNRLAGSGGRWFTCPADGAWTLDGQNCTKVCPANSTWNGGSCVCNAGYVDNPTGNNTCSRLVIDIDTTHDAPPPPPPGFSPDPGLSPDPGSAGCPTE